MDTNTFPTKGNLILAKNTLKLSKLGYDLLDKKRNVLIKEIMDLNQIAADIQASIEDVFVGAYLSLQQTNIDMGIANVEQISHGIEEENSVKILNRSIMGVEIPLVTYERREKEKPFFGLSSSTSALDETVIKFKRAKELIIELAMIENAAYRLAIAIIKTQKRANALKNVTIPKYENLAKHIQATIEERERDEFTRLKVLKRKK